MRFNTRGSYQLPVDYEEAESWRTGKIDSFVYSIVESAQFSGYRSRDPLEYINLVGLHISSNSKGNDFLKVKRAHDFVIAYLNFDIKAFRKSTASFFPKAAKRQDAMSVVRSGYAVEQGYANLFKAVCEAMNITCEVAPGYARDYRFNPFEKNEVKKKRATHYWNIVQVDERWFIVDTAWDAGRVVDNKPLVFDKSYSTEYLFVNPQFFVYTHLPYNLNHELMEYLIQPEDFAQLPYQRPLYFEKVLQMSPRLIKEYDVSGEVLSLSYALRENFELDFLVFDKTGKKDLGKDQKFFEKKQTKRNATQYYFNRRGSYVLRIYSRESFFAGAEYIAECGLVVK
jgi:hypothetical protein